MEGLPTHAGVGEDLVRQLGRYGDRGFLRVTEVAR
jgi:hypothetical protein